MKNTLLSTLLLLTISTPAFAQNQAAFCKLWFTHKADKGVKSAAYTPGIDVHGNAVASANVDAGMPDFAADVISLPLTLDLAKMMNASVPEGAAMETSVGMIDIHRNGKVTLNGKDMSDSAFEFCTGEKPDHTQVSAPVATAPVAPKAPEIPLVKAPVATSDNVMKSDKSTAEPSGKDEIIWGQDY